MNTVAIWGDSNDEKTCFISGLYLEIYNELLMYLRKSFNCPDLHEDIISETFLESVKKKEELFRHPNPKGWIFNTLKYKALKMCTKYSKQHTVESSADDEAYAFCNIQKYDEEMYDTLLLKDWLSKILTDDEIKLLIQYCFLGYSSVEIAACRNENSANVRMRYSRLLKRLRSYCIKNDILK